MPLSLLTFHHIYSARKLSALHTLTKTHHVQGILKHGRPGILLLTSACGDSLHRYIAEVKRMRWQRVEVRGVALELGMRLREGTKKGDLLEVERVRDVVVAAREWGGVEVEEWVKARMGFGKGSECVGV